MQVNSPPKKKAGPCFPMALGWFFSERLRSQRRRLWALTVTSCREIQRAEKGGAKSERCLAGTAQRGAGTKWHLSDLLKGLSWFAKGNHKHQPVQGNRGCAHQPGANWHEP